MISGPYIVMVTSAGHDMALPLAVAACFTLEGTPQPLHAVTGLARRPAAHRIGSNGGSSLEVHGPHDRRMDSLDWNNTISKGMANSHPEKNRYVDML
jgi:hypothetical protein